MKRLIIISGLTVLLFSFQGGAASGQSAKNGPIAKLAHSLVNLHDQYSIYLTQRSAVPFSSSDRLIKLIDNRVVVDAVAAGDVNALKADLESLGMQHAVAFGRFVSGELPLSSIPEAARLTSLRYARSAVAVTSAGAVTTQGDVAMRSNIARANLGVNGAGITVGVLSDSFNCLGGASNDVTSGDLSPVTVIQEISSCSGPSAGTDEGRAMLQIVHDVAPGANLSFASALNGIASYASNIQALAAAGAKIIADDVLYLAEPMFQDGIVAQAVNQVAAGGVAVFSAAGNQGRSSYQSAFRPGTVFGQGAIASAPGAPFFFGGTAHNFNTAGGTDVFQRITLPAGGGFLLSFQWDSPTFSVSGGAGSPNDLDIYVLNAGATQVLAGSVVPNVIALGGNGDPIEVFSFVNTTGATADFNILITNFAGPNPGLIKYVLFNFNGTIQEFPTNSPTIYGHINATGAEAVGAARYSRTPAFGVSPPEVESFSSSGGTPILFDTAGNRLTNAEIGSKPEIVAPDGGDTTFFGTDTDGNGFPNFFGTSAAAPHAAGVAALLFQAKPSSTPLQIYSALENTAIDMGASGFDFDSGFGLIQADAALSVPVDQLLAISINDVAVAEGNVGMGNAVFTVSLSSPSSRTVTVTYSTANGTATAGDDYAATSGTLTFNPGEMSKTITVLVNGDTLREANETFFVNLSNGVNATIAHGQGLGTITNDDPLPAVSINNVSVIEGNAGATNVVFTVSLAAAIDQAVTVTYSTVDGSATAGNDYASASGTLIFDPGETSKAITVLVNGDTVVEGNETFFVHLTSVTNAAVGHGEGIGTIIDDDSAPGARLGNISTRGRVLTGDNVMIGGFIIDGLTPLRVLVRSRGPSMGGAPFFVPGTLANPLLRLFGPSLIAQNDNWQDAPSCSGFVCEGADAIKNIGMDPCEPNPGEAGPPPNCALESAILITLPPGGYTGIITGADGGAGVGLVEVFDADTNAQSELSNISTRSFVQSGDNVMIGGLIIEASEPKTVLIRARGPSMSGAPFNLSGTLVNPLLQLFSDQTLIASNDNWRDLQPDEIVTTGADPCQPNPGQATAPPGCDQESAMVLDLPAGAYTALVSGVGGQTGIGLVEVFEVPQITIPNARGTYQGSATITLSQCTNPANNQINNFVSVIDINIQNGSVIGGTGTFNGPAIGSFNLSGTVTAGFDTMGSFTFLQPGASARGSFTGAGLGNAITLNLTGQAAIPGGGTCTLNGSLSANR